MTQFLQRLGAWADELNSDSAWTDALNTVFDSIGFSKEYIQKAKTAEQSTPFAVKDSVWGIWVSAAYYIMSDKKIPNVYIERGVRRKVLLHAFRTLLSCWDLDPDIHKLKDGK